MKKLAKLSAVLVLALPIVAFAEALPKPVADMECLVGNWKGGGTLVMGKDKANLHATWECSRTSAKFGVMCKFHVTGR